MLLESCPDKTVLTDFVVGKLPENELDTVASHITECDECREVLNSIDAVSDPLLAELRQSLVSGEFEKEPECAQVLDAILALCPEPADVPVEQEELGSIRDYRLLEKIAQGGMGAVYRALHTHLNRVVALKVLPAERMADENAVARFRKEMLAVGKLDHPHIVRALDAGEHEGQHYLVMEFVEGIDLSQLSRQKGPLPIPEACEIVRQVAVGLQFAHERKMVHRDIKPSNLILETGGTVKILDMGLALLNEEHSAGEELTATGQMMGTVDYMAPEQAKDTHNVDIRADIYSLGCTLYKLLSGHAPFSVEKYKSNFEKLMAHAQEEPTSLIELRSDVPLELLGVISRMMAKKIEDRFATPTEVAKALEPFCGAAESKSLIETSITFDDDVDRLAPTMITDTPLRSSISDTVIDTSQKREEKVLPLPQREDRDSQNLPLPLGEGRGEGKKRKRIPPKWLATAAGALFLLAVSTVIYINTGEGQLKITIHESDVVVKIDGNIVNITSPRDTVTIKTGGHELEVTKAGFTTWTTKFRITRNGKTEVDVQLFPKGAGKGLAKSKRKSKAPAADYRAAKWVLSEGGRIGTNAGSPWLKSADDLPEKGLAGFNVIITSASLKNEDLKIFQGVKEICYLSISSKAITGAGLEYLKDTKIHGLFLNGSGVGDQGLKFLQPSQNIAYLDFIDTNITDEGLKSLARLKGLKGLHLARTTITGEGLAHLENITLMYYINLSHTPITNNGLKNLVRLNISEGIQLDHTNIDDSGLKILKSLNFSGSLDVGNTKITDDGIGYISEIKKLKYLGLSNNAITDVGLAKLEKSSLEEINLKGTKVTAAGVAKFRKAQPNCEVRWDGDERSIAEWILSIGGTVAFTVDGKRHHISKLKDLPEMEFQITEISVNGLSEFNDDDLSRLGNLKHFGVLRARETGLTGSGFRNFQAPLWLVDLFKTKLNDEGLSQLKHLKTLTHLVLSATQITDDGLSHLKGMSLQSLQLDHTQITSQGVKNLSSQPGLGLFYLADSNIDNDALKYISQNMPNVKALVVSSTLVNDEGMEYVLAMKNLVDFIALNTSVTRNGTAKLRKNIPRGTVLTSDDQKKAVDWVARIGGRQWVQIVHTSKKTEIRSWNEIVNKSAGLRGVDVSNNEKVNDKDLKNLEGAENMEELNLAGTNISDTGLKHLHRMQNYLQTLDLRRTKVTAKGVAELKKRLPNCKIEWDDDPKSERSIAEWILSIGGTVVFRIDGKSHHISKLEDLPEKKFQITQITVNGITEFNDNDLSRLGNLKHLGVLHAGETGLTGSGFRGFNSPLWLVDLYKTKFNDQGLSHLKHLKTLTHLIVRETIITDDGLSHLKGMSLQSFQLEHTRITSRGIKNLGSQHGLGFFAAADTKIDNDALKYISQNMPNIYFLYVSSTLVNDEGVHHLNSLSNLQFFVAVNTSITREATKELEQKNYKCIIVTEDSQKMAIEWVTKIGGKQWVQIGNTTELSEISEWVAIANKSVLLRRVDLSNNQQVNDDDLKYLAGAEYMEHIIIAVTKLTDAGLQHFYRMRNLQTLDLRRTKVTAKGIAELKKKLLNCKIEWDEVAPHKKIPNDVNH